MNWSTEWKDGSAIHPKTGVAESSIVTILRYQGNEMMRKDGRNGEDVDTGGGENPRDGLSSQKSRGPLVFFNYHLSNLT